MRLFLIVAGKKGNVKNGWNHMVCGDHVYRDPMC